MQLNKNEEADSMKAFAYISNKIQTYYSMQIQFASIGQFESYMNANLPPSSYIDVNHQTSTNFMQQCCYKIVVATIATMPTERWYMYGWDAW